jgi:sulfur-carrier protein adenylyltransferase/sulfurtransferase
VNSEQARETQGKLEVQEISVTELRDRLEVGQPLVLLDVREPHEREIADLPDVGQRRIPMRELLERLDELDPEDNLVVYCRSGARSRWAAGALGAEGFGKVFNLKGGVLAWREEIDPSLRAY